MINNQQYYLIKVLVNQHLTMWPTYFCSISFWTKKNKTSNERNWICWYCRKSRWLKKWF